MLTPFAAAAVMIIAEVVWSVAVRAGGEASPQLVTVLLKKLAIAVPPFTVKALVSPVKVLVLIALPVPPVMNTVAQIGVSRFSNAGEGAAGDGDISCGRIPQLVPATLNLQPVTVAGVMALRPTTRAPVLVVNVSLLRVQTTPAPESFTIKAPFWKLQPEIVSVPQQLVFPMVSAPGPEPSMVTG